MSKEIVCPCCLKSYPSHQLLFCQHQTATSRPALRPDWEKSKFWRSQLGEGGRQYSPRPLFPDDYPDSCRVYRQGELLALRVNGAELTTRLCPSCGAFFPPWPNLSAVSLLRVVSWDQPLAAAFFQRLRRHLQEDGLFNLELEQVNSFPQGVEEFWLRNTATQALATVMLLPAPVVASPFAAGQLTRADGLLALFPAGEIGDPDCREQYLSFERRLAACLQPAEINYARPTVWAACANGDQLAAASAQQRARPDRRPDAAAVAAADAEPTAAQPLVELLLEENRPLAQNFLSLDSYWTMLISNDFPDLWWTGLDGDDFATLGLLRPCIYLLRRLGVL